MYQPPFRITPAIVNLIADISAKVERFAVRMEKRDSLRLRKANRIRTIHSSLAIEGNDLTVGEVRAIMEGKRVVAPLRQIQEVRNAIAAYELYPSLDPFHLPDLLKAHRVMMSALVDNPGRFRSGGVGVFAGEQVIHMAPPASRVPLLMEDLFHWLAKAEDHLLIRSCVFHYEFEFIHPFIDGNGRMGRLWQSLILGRLNPVFAHLPIENLVYADTEPYYSAIAASTNAADSTPFIEYMLGEIRKALTLPDPNEDGVSFAGEGEDDDDDYVGENDGVNVGVKLTRRESMLLNLLAADPWHSAKTLAEQLALSSRQVERLLASLKKKGRLARRGADKSGYWEILQRGGGI